MAGGNSSRPSPPRSANPAGLWSHLLSQTPVPNKNTQAASNTANTSHPRLVPLDKTNSSLRLLLHDTQAHLESFSARVEGLVADVQGARNEVKSVAISSGEAWNKAENIWVELINRCQIQLQTSIGTPAQASTLCTLQATTSAINEAIKVLKERTHTTDKDISLIHVLTQSHNQSLQNISETLGTTLKELQIQSHKLQALHELQSQLLTSILPLLPLVQAIPLHIETARVATISEMRNEFKVALKENLVEIVPGLVKTVISEALEASQATSARSSPACRSPRSSTKRRRDPTDQSLNCSSDGPDVPPHPKQPRASGLMNTRDTSKYCHTNSARTQAICSGGGAASTNLTSSPLSSLSSSGLSSTGSTHFNADRRISGESARLRGPGVPGETETPLSEDGFRTVSSTGVHPRPTLTGNFSTPAGDTSPNFKSALLNDGNVKAPDYPADDTTAVEDPHPGSGSLARWLAAKKLPQTRKIFSIKDVRAMGIESRASNRPKRFIPVYDEAEDEDDELDDEECLQN